MLHKEPALRRVKANSLEFAVWEYPGEEPPIFFCHCAGLCGRTWDPVIRRLGVKNRVFAWDARGHGDSDKPVYPGAYGWDGFSSDLLAVVKALDLPEGIPAVGHSGGAATLVHAELTRPGQFSRLVLFDAIIAPAVFFPTALPLAALSRKRVHVFPSRQAAAERLGGKPPMSRWSPEVLDAYLDHGFSCDARGRLHLKCPGDIEALVYESGGLVDLYGRLGEVQTPALTVTGTDSYMLEHVREQTQRLPHATLVELAGAQHFIPQEQPGACAEMVHDWLLPQG